MTRVIAGSAKSQRLKVPNVGTRPTTDRVKESLFASLDSDLGSWGHLAVLDLFAGSGALGIEALSRGAAACSFVDSAREAAACIRKNLESAGFEGEVLTRRVQDVIRREATSRFNIVFIDPPYDYADSAMLELLVNLTTRGWLADAGTVVLERPARGPLVEWPDGFSDTTSRNFGDTRLERAIWYVS